MRPLLGNTRNRALLRFPSKAVGGSILALCCYIRVIRSSRFMFSPQARKPKKHKAGRCCGKKQIKRFEWSRKRHKAIQGMALRLNASSQGHAAAPHFKRQARMAATESYWGWRPAPDS